MVYPDMQERARGEISNIISDVEHLNMEQLNDLLYTDAFIKESLQLFVPTPENLRIATKDCKFGNVSIPKGTPLMISHVYIHKTDFEKGDEFMPERWLNGDFFKFTIDPECGKYRSRGLITMKLYPDLKIRVHAWE